MCGFAGLLVPASSGHGTPEGRGRLEAAARGMADALVHRGPDDAGSWADPSGRVALAFRRLAILDLSPAGHQPMASRSGRYTLVFNGEIYNFEALRAEVGLPRDAYRGGSDTEVLLAAFDRFGIDATLERLIGMFAIAVWDEERGELSLVRDRMGIKPLYVARTAEGIAFGSELGALLRAPGFDRSIDVQALSLYLRYLFVPAPGTPFRKVHKVMPGHLLRIRDAGAPLPASRPYWSLEAVRQAGAAERSRPRGEAGGAAAVDELDALLSDAVRLRMVADVPVGALLSGGIDSSLVVALMQEQSDRPVRTFTIGFDHREHDESSHARAVAEHLGTDHTELPLTGQDALDLVPRLPEIFDEPLADPSQIPTYLISALARRSVTVALTGDGGDELFGGYNRYRFGPSAARRIRRIPKGARSRLAAALASPDPGDWDRLARLPGIGRRMPRLAGQKAHKLARLLACTSDAETYRTLLSTWDDPDRFLAGPAPEEEDADPIRELLRAASAPLSLDEMLHVDQRTYLPDDLLQKVDRASMAVSLEVRVPLLDHRVVEASWRLGEAAKIRGSEGKWILRQLLDRRVPRALLDRPKTGFSVPVDAWLAGPLRGWAEELLLSTSPARDAWLAPLPIVDAWRRFRQGRTELALGLWSVLMLEAWRRHWKLEDFEGPPA